MLLPLLFCSLWGIAQEAKTEMADVMRSNGKIYVVITIILTIFLGLTVYLVRLDGKIKRLEKNNE